MRVIDGAHRLRAARLAGRPTIDVVFLDGTEAELLAIAVRANASHGLPLTRADREAAAARMIDLLPRHSDRWIASLTGLAPGTIASLRSAQGTEACGATRVGMDGRERPVDIASRRRAAADAIREHPEASLRAIAQLAGISPGTVRDVRRRVLDGEDPVPLSLAVPREEKAVRRGGQPPRQPPGQRAGSDRPPAAPAGDTRSREVLMASLRRDPALRLNGAGRGLLELLGTRAAGPNGLDTLMDAVPAHCAFLVSKVARLCSEEWLEAARRLEKRAEAV
jgi:ParB-like chromosome segregation protein Spo0J